MKTSQTTRFEVRCPSCDVSFPVGTKHCVHCGARIGGGLLTGAPGVRTHPVEPGGAAPAQGGVPRIDYERGESPFDESDEEFEQRPTLLRRSITLIWVLLLIGFSVMRACMEGNG